MPTKKGTEIASYEIRSEYLYETKCQDSIYEKERMGEQETQIQASGIMYVAATNISCQPDLTTVQMI